jgi:Flp pilus assembly protein TadG
MGLSSSSRRMDERSRVARRHRARDRRGVAALEFGLIAPLMIALLLPIADLGFAALQYISAYQALRAVGAYALYHPPPDLANRSDLQAKLEFELSQAVSATTTETKVKICGDTLASCSDDAVPVSTPRSFLFTTTLTITPIFPAFDVCGGGCTVHYLERFQ